VPFHSSIPFRSSAISSGAFELKIVSDCCESIKEVYTERRVSKAISEFAPEKRQKTSNGGDLLNSNR
jgi:hypothetical protein